MRDKYNILIGKSPFCDPWIFMKKVSLHSYYCEWQMIIYFGQLNFLNTVCRDSMCRRKNLVFFLLSQFRSLKRRHIGKVQRGKGAGEGNITVWRPPGSSHP